MAEDPRESRSGRLRILVESEASVLSQGNSRGIVRKCQGRTSHSSRQRCWDSSGRGAEGPGINCVWGGRQAAGHASPSAGVWACFRAGGAPTGFKGCDDHVGYRSQLLQPRDQPRLHPGLQNPRNLNLCLNENPKTRVGGRAARECGEHRRPPAESARRVSPAEPCALSSSVFVGIHSGSLTFR